MRSTIYGEGVTMKDNTSGVVKLRRNLFWIIFVFLGVYLVLSGFGYIPWEFLMYAVDGYLSDGMRYILEFYTSTIVEVVSLFLLTWLIRPNRYVWKSFLLPKRKKKDAAQIDQNDILADYYGRSKNGFKMLGLGLLLGFFMNFVCVLCALLHGDIRLYFESSWNWLPIFLFAFVSVFIQSTCEELWCRGLLYERLHEHHPMWAAILINGVLFGLLHIFNDGATVLAIIEIMICGITYSLIRWYTGNIWIAMGIHTGWNFTQAFLLGMPNSGLVSEVSLFHLESANGVNNPIYDFRFGVEGGLPAVIVDLIPAVVVLILAKKNGRLKELAMSREKDQNKPQNLAYTWQNLVS